MSVIPYKRSIQCDAELHEQYFAQPDNESWSTVLVILLALRMLPCNKLQQLRAAHRL